MNGSLQESPAIDFLHRFSDFASFIIFKGISSLFFKARHNDKQAKPYLQIYKNQWLKTHTHLEEKKREITKCLSSQFQSSKFITWRASPKTKRLWQKEDWETFPRSSWDWRASATHVNALFFRGMKAFAFN